MTSISHQNELHDLCGACDIGEAGDCLAIFISVLPATAVPGPLAATVFIRFARLHGTIGFSPLDFKGAFEGGFITHLSGCRVSHIRVSYMS